VLKLFSAGLIANLVYVLSGVFKQYLIAAQLPVASVGIYGAWVAQAALLLVLLPFPAYLDVLIRGFSSPVDDPDPPRVLIAAVMRELRILSGIAVAGVLLTGLLDLASGKAFQTSAALLLLLLGQYVSLTSDILLRMRQAHLRFAVFMATRNLPSLAAIVLFGIHEPFPIVLAELGSALSVGWFVYRSRPLQPPPAGHPKLPRIRIYREQTTLWLARLGQYVNNSLMRLIVPFIFGAHDTGLFFFACIAQIPCALFLSVTTQLFGHALSRTKSGGGYGVLLRIQLWFAIPNVLYVLALALLMPYWPLVTQLVPKLQQYSGVGHLIFAVASYSAVLSSDCTEYLLRARGLSRFLLRYNVCSVLAQLCCFAVGALEHMSIEATIVLCAVAAMTVLLCFTVYSFRRVVGHGGETPHAVVR